MNSMRYCSIREFWNLLIKWYLYFVILLIIHSAIVLVKDVNQQVFIRYLAEYLKKTKKVELPEWVDYVKTGYAKELPPNTQDWLYVRMGMLSDHLTMHHSYTTVLFLCQQNQINRNNK